MTPKSKPKSVPSPLRHTGSNPETDAWLTSFYIENHLDFFTYPDHAATEEQVRFMVYTEEGERYYPCSDQMYEAIISRKQPAFVQENYGRVLKRLLDLINRQIEDDYEKAYLKALIVNKHHLDTRDEIIIPTRLEKRLMSIYLKRTLIEDPFQAEKAERNRRAHSVLNTQAFQDALNYVARDALRHPPDTLADIKSLIAEVEFKRLLCAANSPTLWMADPKAPLTRKDFLEIFDQPLIGEGLKPLLQFLGLGRPNGRKRKLLWLADEAGEFVMDLALIRLLVTHGHKVIIAFKDGPLYTKTTLRDMFNDPALETDMDQIAVIEDPNLSKNQLVRTLRGDIPVLALSDGTCEIANLLLTSTTFARIFKEMDAVITRGPECRRRFMETHFRFTQDVYNITRQNDGNICVGFKPRHAGVIKFSHQDLENKAQTIIDQMKAAKADGMTVIFYSGIIGSIPGKIDMAKRIMSVYVNHLGQQSAQTFIINPSEYYEPGMDADDLMYMWEIVQRSGQIDIWRFQTYDDIVEAFQIMEKKIPPEWVGKDATYSTGCTKEMTIAIDVQRHHPEMQIIGPARERFMRRQDYGVGKMYDRRLTDR